jgi:hypothetical protein
MHDTFFLSFILEFQLENKNKMKVPKTKPLLLLFLYFFKNGSLEYWQLWAQVCQLKCDGITCHSNQQNTTCENLKDSVFFLFASLEDKIM